MTSYFERVFDGRPLRPLGRMSQRIRSNWKLMMENIKDPYHASLLHVFLVSFGLFRADQKSKVEMDESGGHAVLVSRKGEQKQTAGTAEIALECRRAFLNKWRAKCPGVARSLEEAGDRLFTFLRFPPSQWKSLRTTNAIERLNLEFRRRGKVQGLEPNGDSVCMLFWALLASGAITMRKVDGYESLKEQAKEALNLAA